jgi:putative transposase
MKIATPPRNDARFVFFRFLSHIRIYAKIPFMTYQRWTLSNTSVFNISSHLIGCPKYRRKVLVGEMESRVKELLFQKSTEIGVDIAKLEVMPERLHKEQKKQMRTYVFKFYCSKRNKHIHRKLNLVGSIHNHLIAPHRRYYRIFGKGIDAAHLQPHITREKIESLLFMRQASDKLKKLSRKLSAKKRGSNNRDKARLNLVRTHQKIANQRRDFHYKVALAFVRRYAFVFVEDLRAMQRIWGRKVSDLGHAQFLNILAMYKNGSQGEDVRPASVG